MPAFTHSSRATDEMAKTWRNEDAWHGALRVAHLDMMRAQRAEAKRQALARRELFWTRQRAAERAAAVVQRACDAAASAEIVFLPTVPAARAIALRTWAHDPCKIDAWTRRENAEIVSGLPEPPSKLGILGLSAGGVEKAREAFNDLVDRPTSRPTSGLEKVVDQANKRQSLQSAPSGAALRPQSRERPIMH